MPEEQEAKILHELARGVEAREVAELSHGGDGHRGLHAAERLQRVDDRREPPRLRLLEELDLQAAQELRAFGDGPNVLLEDNLLRGLGNTRRASQRRCSALQFARPVYRISFRGSSAFRRLALNFLGDWLRDVLDPTVQV